MEKTIVVVRRDGTVGFATVCLGTYGEAGWHTDSYTITDADGDPDTDLTSATPGAPDETTNEACFRSLGMRKVEDPTYRRPRA